MTDPPEEWSHVDPDDLPVRWRDPDDPSGECDRCGTESDAELCERCFKQVERNRTRPL